MKGRGFKPRRQKLEEKNGEGHDFSRPSGGEATGFSRCATVDHGESEAKISESTLRPNSRALLSRWVTIRAEFRARDDEEPYEYLLEWLRAGEPARPELPSK